MVRREISGDMPPHEVRLGKAMQKYDGGTAPRHRDVQFGVGRHRDAVVAGFGQECQSQGSLHSLLVEPLSRPRISSESVGALSPTKAGIVFLTTIDP